MSNTIVKRMEKLLVIPCLEQKKESPVNTCTRQKRLREMQAELITQGSLTEVVIEDLTEDLTGISIRDLIDARIAQIERVDGTANQRVHHAPNDKNRTIINLQSLAASIYFWSPYAAWTKEERKSKFMNGRFEGRSSVNNDNDKNSAHRKDTFINFSQAALVMVARNPQTPSSTLKWLAAHHSPEVRKSVAQNESTDDETLLLLIEDVDVSVKIALLDNPRINKDLAAKLSHDPNFAVGTKASKKYYELEMQSKEPIPLCKQTHKEMAVLKDERDFLKIVADSNNNEQRLFVQSSKVNSDWHIRMLVAGDPNATAEILWQLASHPISQVKRKLVDKYSCLLETMVNLTGNRKTKTLNGLAASATQTIN